MKLDTSKKILIVGLGLLGGSYARALTKKGYYVTAITRSQSSIDYALSEKIITKGAACVDPALVGEADLIVFALYPHVFIDWIRENQSLFKSGAIITDVTGVKGAIVDTIQNMLRPDVEFIAAHPMAGREVYGVQNSNDAIFKGANYVVTPSEKNTPDAIELCRDLGEVLGFANVSQLAPAEHDQIIAFVSQLTHCIAMTLMTCQQTEHLEDYTGDSFRDLTRIARMNDEMWSELFIMNKEPLIREIENFEKSLSKLKKTIIDNDRESMREMMRISTSRRKRFDKRG